MVESPATWRTEPGLTGYDAALEVMRARIAAIRAGAAEELIWLVEHPPLYTAGTSARPEDLQDAGRFPTFAAGRGGQWTYHGPGQRVVYAMLDLERAHGQVPARDIRAYVAGLERWMIATLAEFGITGETRAGRVGIWVERGGAESKIGAIGVRVSRWVTWHGLSLNVNPELGHFAGIIPCGIREHGVTSLAALGVSATMDEVDAALARHFAEVFG
jgi:lipoyl(octanoyl) transferase